MIMAAINDGFKAYLTKLNQLQKEIFEHLTKLIRVMTDVTQKNSDPRLKLARDLNALLELLQDLLGPTRPTWIVDLRKTLDALIATPLNPDSIFSLMSIRTKIQGLTWSETSLGSRGIDFEKLYADLRVKHKLDEHFESIVSHLEKIIESDLIDSRKIQDSLEDLLATVRRHRSASYFSLAAVLVFSRSFLTNSVWNYLERADEKLGPAVKALKTAIEDTKKAMGKTYTEMEEEVSKQARARVEVLAKPLAGMLNAPSEASQLPSPEDEAKT